tara:strand:- start:989 stop:1786 length:798 start_codon:yes stop_codon:yes gene_type:complete
MSNGPFKKQKRGRKPRGGKIIDAPHQNETLNGYAPPVVLHLKCRMSDLESEVCTNGHSPVPYEDQSSSSSAAINNSEVLCQDDTRTIDEKLIAQSEQMNTNGISDKESACFWCTYQFEGRPVYIPRSRADRGLRGYGCFCSPECAAAYLFSQKNLDKSAMHEQYFLLNNLYGHTTSSYKPIKVAPDPHFLLSRFSGTLSIEEYRKLSSADKVVLVVSEPLTRALPEIHMHPIGLCQTSHEQPQYRLSRKDRPKSKTQRLNQAFGL